MATALAEGGTFFPLGDIHSSLYVVGTLATDYICDPVRIPEVENGGKLTVHTRREMNDIVRRYGIQRRKEYPGSSTGNFVNEAAEIALLDPDYGRVRLFTTLAPDAPTTEVLLDALHEKQVATEVTPYIGPHADNPEALLVPFGKETQIVSLKSRRTPAISVFLPDGEDVPGAVFINAAAGKGAKTIMNGLEFAADYDVPIGTVATGSEIKELFDNPALLDAHKKKMEQVVFFAGNRSEIEGIMEATQPGIRHSGEGTTLARRFRDMFDNQDMIVLLTQGEEGSRVLVGNTVYVERVDRFHPSAFDNTVGAGDTKAAAFAQGLRMWGAGTDGIMHALPRATRAAESVMMYPDARTGQPSGNEWLNSLPRPPYRIEIEELV